MQILLVVSLLAFVSAPLLAGAEKLSFAPRADPSAAQAMRILRANCLSCHNDEKKKGGLRLTSRENVLKGGESGPVLVPRKPGESMLAKVILPDSDPHMPPKKQLAEKDIAILRAWIAGGAKWDAKALAENPAGDRQIRLAAMPLCYQPVLALALSPDEKYLAIARANHIVLHQLTQTNRPAIGQMEAHRDAVQSLAWSPDGKWLASGSFRKIVLSDIADPLGARPIEITNTLIGRITAIQFTSNSTMLVVSDGVPTQSGLVHFVALPEGQCKACVPTHHDSIYALRISPDGKLLATGGADKLVKLWDMETHQEIGKLEAHNGHVLALAFNQDGSMLATGSADKVLNIWDVKTRKQEITINKHPAPITALAWTPDGKTLFSACEDGSARLFTDFKLHTGAESSEAARDRIIATASEMLYSLAALANGKLVFAGAYDGTVYVWTNDGKLQGKLVPNDLENQTKLSD